MRFEVVEWWEWVAHRLNTILVILVCKLSLSSAGVIFSTDEVLSASGAHEASVWAAIWWVYLMFYIFKLTEGINTPATFIGWTLIVFHQTLVEFHSFIHECSSGVDFLLLTYLVLITCWAEKLIISRHASYASITSLKQLVYTTAGFMMTYIRYVFLGSFFLGLLLLFFLNLWETLFQFFIICTRFYVFMNIFKHTVYNLFVWWQISLIEASPFKI